MASTRFCLRTGVRLGALAFSLWAADCLADDSAQSRTPVDVARQVDSSLAAELPGSSAGARTLAVADDEAFLRRATQDLTGELPSPEEVTAFVLDPAADKRDRAVERLLADERYGANWARYFRDVILYRRTDERGLLAAPSIVEFLTEKLNAGAGWNEIASEFVTAEGDIRDHGETGLIMAQMGQPPEIAAETARIFLGVQIQCAQCHDHPTDRWKRQQFHELAAFFPRVTVRAVRDGEQRSFAVASREIDPKRAAKNNKPRGAAEYYMPDLNDPSAKGTMITPVFFVSGEKLEEGVKDTERRAALARWMTDRQNPWFARAIVNRLWAELVGQGFYEPIDDLGPDRTATAPQTLDILAAAFADHAYDLKWLMRSIMATATYQRAQRNPAAEAPPAFVENRPTPLRADQVFTAVAKALAIDEARFAPPPGKGRPGQMRGPRGEFSRTFGFDPSAPRDEVAASIPQALLMMNSPLLNRSMSSTAEGTVLKKLLADNTDDEAVATELYLRCLAREPKPAELETCLGHVRSMNDRNEAFEDILWALVNSTEFTHRK